MHASIKPLLQDRHSSSWLAIGLVTAGLTFWQLPLLVVGSFAASIGGVLVREMWRNIRAVKFGFNWRTAVLFGATVLAVLDATAGPASAQFFGNAENWMQNNIDGVDNGFTSTVFFVLRAMLLIYLAIALIRVIVAVRQDEDWQGAARTPIIILLILFAGEQLTNLIPGSSGGSA